MTTSRIQSLAWCSAFLLVAASVLVGCASTGAASGTPCAYLQGIETVTRAATPVALDSTSAPLAIAYPDLALRYGVDGRVLLRFVVDEAGRPDSVFILRGVEVSCDKEAHRAIRTATYVPAKDAQGRPIRARAEAIVQFERSCSNR